jgi:hypothetical protein
MARMKVGDFMALLEERTLELLPARLRKACTHRVRFVWFQVHFHSPKVHYEVWLARKTERIEIGLHFEGPQEFSYHWAGLIADRMAEIQAQLGPDYELEEWTASWARLHETVPYDPPTPDLADEIATRFARLIAVCQPIVESLRDEVPLPIEAPSAARKPRRFGARKARA